MKAFLFALLLATSAGAQLVVGPEVLSTPIDRLGDIALAPQRGGFVVAWEAAGRIYAGHLDDALQATGPILTLPLSDPQASATSPAIATNGSTVLVAWQEHHPDVNVVATLNADASVLLYGPHRLNSSVAPPVAGVADGTYVVYSNVEYRLNDALESDSPAVIPPGMTAAISSEGTVATATQDQNGAFSCVNFGGWGGGDCNPSVNYTFWVPSGKIVKKDNLFVKQGGSFSSLPPIAGPNGSAFTALLRRSDKTQVLLFDSAIRLTSTLPVTIMTPAAIAGNGSDILIVWTGQGLILHSDGSVSQPFVIGPNSLGNPHVVAAGSNEFVVFYTVDTAPNQKAIAGRVIHLQLSKKRATR